MHVQRRVIQRLALGFVLVSMAVARNPASAVTIDWVTVGDPGNTADTTTYGAVDYEFRIMKYEWTNAQYVDFLNSVAATDTYSLYNTNMGSNARGGITRSGTSGAYTYAVRSNMGDKPVNYISWFDAARVANWLMNGATGTSSTETGAYTLVGGQTSGTAPAKNTGAQFYIPTENEWYKAAYYKGSGTNAGYWDYATQNDTAPTAVTSGSTGIGSAGSTGNFANFNRAADWNSQDGNVTTVGTNGGPSAYEIYDMNGNVAEWNDLDGTAGESRGRRGGDWFPNASNLSSSFNSSSGPENEYNGSGFRLAAVPEPSTWVMGLAGIACAGWGAFRRRKQPRSIASVIVAVAAIAVSSVTLPAAAEQIIELQTPAGLNPVDQFRFVFVTANVRTAESSDIASYNEFVNDDAGGATYDGTTVVWKAIGSTATVNARDNVGGYARAEKTSCAARRLGRRRLEGDFAAFSMPFFQRRS